MTINDKKNRKEKKQTDEESKMVKDESKQSERGQ